MAIVVTCDECGKKYSVGDHLAGKRGKCKACGAVFTVPALGASGTTPKQASLMKSAQVRAEPSLDPSETDLSSVSSAEDASAYGTLAAESVAAGPGLGLGDDVVPDEEQKSRIVDPDNLFPPRATKGIFGPAEPFVPKMLLALGLGIPALLSVKFAMDLATWWGPLSGALALVLLTFFLIVPVSMIGLKSALNKLHVGRPADTKARLLGAISMPVGGVLLGYWIGGPQGMIAGALIGLIPGAVALAYQFGLNVTEAAVTVGGVAAAWVVATGVAVAFAFGTGFAVNTVVQTIQDRQHGTTAVVPTTKPIKPIVLGPTTEPPATQPTTTAVVGVTPPAGPVVLPTDPAVPVVVAPLAPSDRQLSSENLIVLRDKLLDDAKAHDGILAPDLATLASRSGLPASALDSPVGRASTGSDYLYLLSGVTMQTPLPKDIVVAYDFADAEQGTGANVLMGDGTVKFVEADALKELLVKTKEALPPPGAIMLGMGHIVQPPVATPVQPKVEPTAVVAPGPVHEPAEAPTSADRPKWVTSVDLLPIQSVANDVIMPGVGSAFVGVVTHGANDEETIQRFNVLTKEAGPKITFKKDPNAPTKYILSPTGETVVRIVSWPRLSAQVWTFDGNKSTRAIDLTVAGADPRLLGFVSPAQFTVVWERGNVRGVEVWDVKTGARGKQISLPDFTADRGNLNPTSDPRLFGVGTQFDGKNTVQLVDVTGLRLPRKFPVTSIDPRWPLKVGGIALSPDGSKVATIFEHDKDALIVIYRSQDGKILSEIPCSPGVLPPTSEKFTGSAMQWLDDESPWLVYGNVIDSTGQKVGAIVDDRTTLGQAFVNKETAVLLLSGSSADSYEVAVVKYALPKAAK